MPVIKAAGQYLRARVILWPLPDNVIFAASKLQNH